MLRGAENRGKDLLRVGAASRAVPTTAHLACNHRGTQHPLGTPVGGVQVGADENAEERGQFDLEMSRESLHVRNRARIVEQIQHVVEEMPARDIDTVRRDPAGGATVSHIECMLEDARVDTYESEHLWVTALLHLGSV